MAKQQTVEQKVEHNIAAQILALQKKRDEITERRRQYFAEHGLGGGPTNLTAATERAKAVNELARSYLNGHGSLVPTLPSAPNPDHQWEREQNAIDLAIGILRKEETKAAAVAALKWREKNLPAWNEIVRRMVLAAIEVERCANEALTLLRTCPDREAIKLTFDRYIGGRASVELAGYPVREVVGDAIDAGIISANEGHMPWDSI